MKNLRNVITLVLMTLFSITIYAQSESVVGEWVVGKQNTVIKIAQENEAYTGKIVSSNNEKAEIGKLMVKDVKQVEGQWKGKVYSPKRKKWYDTTFIPNKKELNIELSVGFFNKTITWVEK
ncbi:MAG: DUF2147 domain-containing protein [Flavobacteriaceae bacterium]|nr:MAG: DUF2147 domain-containing protein [Flavobacteriaceae bacterium]